MKKAAKEETPGEGSKNTAAKSSELKTDYPLSEKDEIKKAEEKMRQRRKYIL